MHEFPNERQQVHYGQVFTMPVIEAIDFITSIKHSTSKRQMDWKATMLPFLAKEKAKGKLEVDIFYMYVCLHSHTSSGQTQDVEMRDRGNAQQAAKNVKPESDGSLHDKFLAYAANSSIIQVTRVVIGLVNLDSPFFLGAEGDLAQLGKDIPEQFADALARPFDLNIAFAKGFHAIQHDFPEVKKGMLLLNQYF